MNTDQISPRQDMNTFTSHLYADEQQQGAFSALAQ